MNATLSASINSAENFELVVEAEGIAGDFVAGAKNGAITALVSQSWSPIFCVKLRLFDFRPDEIDSSYAAYYAAANEVVARLLGVAPDTAHNISW
jgi:hypothetical protein